MKYLPSRTIVSTDIYEIGGKIDPVYCDITQYDVFREVTSGFSAEDYIDVDVDITKEEGKIILTVPQEKIISFLERAKEITQHIEYYDKYIALGDRLGVEALKYIIERKMIDPDLLLQYLPSKELIEEDSKLYHQLSLLSCFYHGTDEGMLSIELAKKLALKESLDEYPEEMIYHYYCYPSTSKSIRDVPFTKSEFLKSVEKEQKQRILRKK